MGLSADELLKMRALGLRFRANRTSQDMLSDPRVPTSDHCLTGLGFTVLGMRVLGAEKVYWPIQVYKIPKKGLLRLFNRVS